MRVYTHGPYAAGVALYGVAAALLLPVSTSADAPREAFWPHNRALCAMTISIPRGQWVDAAGDVDGDGSEDLILALGRDPAGFAVLFGGAFSAGTHRWNDPPARRAEFISPVSAFCQGRAEGVGDVNGDGFSDFVLGPLGRIQDGGASISSWLLLVFGGADLSYQSFDLSGDVEKTTRILAPSGESDMFLSPVLLLGKSPPAFRACGGGDFDGDGIGDLAIALECRRAPDTVSRPGIVFVVPGRLAWPAEAPIDELSEKGLSLSGMAGDFSFPADVSFPGDLDGDDICELAVTGGSGPALGSPPEKWWRTTVFFGGSVGPGATLSLLEAQQNHWTIGRCMIAAGAGDMDGDGYDDALVCSSPLTVEELPAGGFVLYGGPRDRLRLFRSAEDLVHPNASRVEGPPIASAYLPDVITDPGVTILAGGHDWDEDGVPDIATGCPAREVYFARAGYPNAGAVGIIAGRSPRAEILTPAAPYLEGFFRGESLGRHLFFTSLGGRVFLAASSLAERSRETGEELILSLIPPPPWKKESLALDYVLDASSSLLLLGAGFAPGLRVFFGETEAISVELYSASVARAFVPPGPLGVSFAIEARLGDESAFAPTDYTYPLEEPTPVVDLASLRGKGVARLFAGAPDREIIGAVLAGDIDGDGKGEIVVQTREDAHGEFLILSHDVARAADVDVTAPGALLKARFQVLGSDSWDQNMDAADFDGDSIDDLVVLSPLHPGTASTYGLVFGGENLLRGGNLAPGEDTFLLHTPPIVYHDLGSFPGDLDGDRIAEFVATYLMEPPDSATTVRALLVLRGGPLWRQQGEAAVEDLIVRKRAALLLGASQILPAGEFDGLPPAETLLVGSRKKPSGANESVLALTSRLPEAGETSYGDFLVAGEALTKVEISRPGTLLRGPVDLDGLGTPGFVVGRERVSLPSTTVPGRILTVALDAWNSIPDGLSDLSAPSDRGAAFEDDPSGQVNFESEQFSRPTPVGDFDADGATDFLLPVERLGLGDERHRAFLLYGGPHLLDGRTRSITLLGSLGADLAVPGNGIGYMVGPARDLDGDGFDDILLGFGRPTTAKEFYLVCGRAERFLRPATDQASFRRGDANGDGKVNVADPLWVLGYLFGKGTAPGCEDAADANDDERLNVADAIIMLNHLFGKAGPLSDPFVTCGRDAGSGLGCAEFPPCRGR